MTKPNQSTQFSDQDEIDAIDASENCASPEILQIEDLNDFLG